MLMDGAVTGTSRLRPRHPGLVVGGRGGGSAMDETTRSAAGNELCAPEIWPNDLPGKKSATNRPAYPY